MEVVGAAAIGEAYDEVVAAGDAALAAEFPADSFEWSNGGAGFFPVVDADEDVDDGFGGEADDRGAADVFDGLDLGADGFEDSGFGCFECPWPSGVVVDDDRRCWLRRRRWLIVEVVGHFCSKAEDACTVTLARATQLVTGGGWGAITRTVSRPVPDRLRASKEREVCDVRP